MTLPLLADQPQPPVRCRRCRRVCSKGTIGGLGPGCAVIEGVSAPRWPRRGRVVRAADTPSLLDLINQGVIMTDQNDNVLANLEHEIARQDHRHPSGYPATRDGVFLGITTAIHELEREAIEAWRSDRCRCDVPDCGHATWAKTRAELVQAAAVIVRTVRSIDYCPAPEETR